jgi:hypothetical protein
MTRWVHTFQTWRDSEKTPGLITKAKNIKPLNKDYILSMYELYNWILINQYLIRMVFVININIDSQFATVFTTDGE